ncbi:MAG: glycoside hydrolase family 5 protein, partial [Lysobacter sp.]
MGTATAMLRAMTALALASLLTVASGVAGAANLQRGVNLSRWFEASAGAPVEASELRMLREAGFDHVRIPVDPVALGWSPERGPSIPGSPRLRAAVDAALGAGLDVIVDLHPNEDTKRSIEQETVWSDGYIAMWQHLATQFKSLPAQRVAFELFNEPGYYGLAGRFTWPRYQKRLVQAVRAIAPDRSLIVSGRKGGSLEGLVELDPLDDPNLIYSFHYYLPYIFTHQGASWMQGDEWTTAGHWRRVRYPATVARKQLPRTDGKVEFVRARDELTEYFQSDWDRKQIDAQWRPLREWAAKNHVRVHCGEFGVIRDGVDPVSRYRWIGDVRWLAQAEGWGWSVWN